MTQVPWTPHRRFITPDFVRLSTNATAERMESVGKSVYDHAVEVTKPFGCADSRWDQTYSAFDIPFGSRRASCSALMLGSCFLFQCLDVCLLEENLKGFSERVEHSVRELVIFSIGD